MVVDMKVVMISLKVMMIFLVVVSMEVLKMLW
jgi:hypothetical protein